MTDLGRLSAVVLGAACVERVWMRAEIRFAVLGRLCGRLFGYQVER